MKLLSKTECDSVKTIETIAVTNINGMLLSLLRCVYTDAKSIVKICYQARLDLDDGSSQLTSYKITTAREIFTVYGELMNKVYINGTLF